MDTSHTTVASRGHTGVFARDDGADFAPQPYGLGTIQRRHLHCLQRGDCCGILRHTFREDSGHLHLCDHVQSVVRAGAIRAYRDVGAGSKEGVYWAEATGQFEIGGLDRIATTPNITQDETDANQA